jgi:hypothetical protein
MLHCTTGIQQFLVFRGMCLRRLCSVSPSSPWLGFHGDYFPTAPAAASLRPIVTRDFLIICQSVQFYHHHRFFHIMAHNSYVRWVPFHHGMARPQVADGGDALQFWRVAANILNKQSRTADKGWSSSLGVARGVNSSP